jgi:hypothetical protein
MFWVHDPQPLSAELGMHRFIWDLHFAFPASVHPSFYGPSAPLVLPGDYTVKLTVDGQSYSQPLLIKMDPRVKTSSADLEKMFQAASQVTANLGDLASAVEQAQKLKTAIAARKKESSAKKTLSEELTSLDRKTSELLGAETEPEFGLFGLSLPPSQNVTLRETVTATTGLLYVVQSSDSAPTRDDAVAIQKWDLATKDLLERWQAFWQQDRQQVNSLLQKAKLKPL